MINIISFKPICEISTPNKIQSMFWDKDNCSLFLSRNIIGSRGGRIDEIKFNNLNMLVKGICPSFKTVNATIFLSIKELEGYSKCVNN
jgi:hypothetical protein